MPSAAALKAGKAVIEMSLLTGPVEKGLKSLQSKAKEIGSGFTKIGKLGLAAGGAIGGAMLAAATSFAETGSELALMSEKTGLSVENLSELKFAAGRTGGSLETVGKAAKGMAKFMDGVRGGGAEANQTLFELGLTAADLKNKSPDQTFEALAAAVNKVKDPTQKAALALKVFGKSGIDLIPMLAQMESLRAKSVALGTVVSDDDAKAAKELDESFFDLTAQTKAVIFQLGAAIAGPLTGFFQGTQPIIKGVIDWVKANGPLIRTIGEIAAVIAGAGALLVAVGVGFNLVASVAGGLAGAVGLVTTILGAVAGALFSLLSPVGLVVAAIAGLTVWFATSTDSGRDLVASLGSSFGELKDTAVEAFGGISDALSAGDLQLAAKILWTGLNVAWLEGTEVLRGLWYSMTASLTKAWFNVVAGIQEVWNELSSALEIGWSATTEFLTTAWDTWVSGFKKAWNDAIAFFQTTWLRIKGLFGADVQAEIARINSAVDSANKKLDGDAAQGAADRNAAGQASRDQTRADSAKRLDQIGADLNSNSQGADQDHQDKLDAANKALTDAQSQLADLRKGAAAEAKQKTDEAKGKVKGAEASVDTPEFKAATASSAIFDTRNIAQMFGGDVQHEQLAALKRIDKNTKNQTNGVPTG